MNRRVTLGIAIVILASALGAATAEKRFPSFHGEKTPLQELLSHLRDSRLVDGYVWTYSDFMVLIQLYPSPMDFRAEDVPFQGRVPWRPAWESGWVVKSQLTSPQQEIFARSRVTMLLREQDGKTCVVNELTGERIFTEKAPQQDATAVEIPCEKIWSQFETLVQLPEPAKSEISRLLKTPPSPPKFKRKAQGEGRE
jgi:hypothetical protein